MRRGEFPFDLHDTQTGLGVERLKLMPFKLPVLSVLELPSSSQRGIDADGIRYAIAKGAAIQYKTLSDWLSGNRDIALSTASKLAEFLQLELHPINKPKGKYKVNAPAVPAVDWATANPEKKRKDEGRQRRK